MARRYRGTRQERGYDAEHDRLRAAWKPIVDAGDADCHEPICLEPERWIKPGTDWDLSHSKDRSGWTGPSHATCNRSAGGKQGNPRSPDSKRPKTKRWRPSQIWLGFLPD